MIINREQQQSYEDTYGNEVKRRRMNDEGEHLKVWRAYQSIYTSDEEKKKREAAVQEEDVRIVQEVVDIKEEEVQEVQEVQDPAPVHMIGRSIVVLTTANQQIRGRLQSLFVLNGERAIHMTTDADAGENFILTSSQIQDLKVLYDAPAQPQPQQEEEEMLSPIPRNDDEQIEDDDDEVVQIDDDDEVVQIEDDEVVEMGERIERIQIDSDDDDDATTVQMERDDREDDFPDVPFQPARQEHDHQEHDQQEHDQQEDVQEDVQEDHECCAICLDMTDAARNYVSLNCGHKFHFNCMLRNMMTAGQNRNNCPMCRDQVSDQYAFAFEPEMSIDEMLEYAARRNQQIQDELDLTRQHREVLTEEYVRVMTMNMQIGMRHNQERHARDALERRAEMCSLNERIIAIVENAANNDLHLRRNQEVHVHVERQIRDLCMSFGMMAYDAQYDDAEHNDAEHNDAQHNDAQQYYRLPFQV
jgi:hypothetical protein